jgi:SAM-dependent methyltransferase
MAHTLRRAVSRARRLVTSGAGTDSPAGLYDGWRGALSVDEDKVQAIYDQLQTFAQTHEVTTDVTTQLSSWQKSWRVYFNMLKNVPTSFEGKTVVDFGSRYGFIAPLLFELGAKRVIGVEGLDTLLQFSREIFRDSPRIEFVKSEYGYIPLQPDTADLMIMNEVISHVHPTYLPTVYSEAARILVPGGMLFISDGNNLGNTRYVQERLLPLYNGLENGPDGIQAGEVVVQACFVNQRKWAIQARHPSLPIEQVEYLALNTSGLFGDFFFKVIDAYVRNGELIRRPYREGTPPTYPESGIVEERGFHPEHVVYELMQYGFTCEILNRPPRPPGVERRVALGSQAIVPATGFGKFAFQAPIPVEFPGQRIAILLENDEPLACPGTSADEIGVKGLGRYSVWEPNRTIYFSSSDNTDPRANRRRYELFWRLRHQDVVEYPTPNFQIVGVKTR